MSEEQTFNQSLKENIYFTMRGCEERGSTKIDNTLLNFIYNISGLCTDSGEGPDYYNNPRAMFVALDLIYKAIEETFESESLRKLALKSTSKEAQEVKE